MKQKSLFFILGVLSSFPAFAEEVHSIEFQGQEGQTAIDIITKKIFVSFPYEYLQDRYPLKEAKLVRIETENNVPSTLPETVDLRTWVKFNVGADEWLVKGGYQLPGSDFGTWHQETISGFITLGKVECEEMVGHEDQTIWDNGNPAFSASGSKNWPTKKLKLNDDSYAAELTTRRVMGIIASGNLFTGRIVRNMSLGQLMGFTSKDGKALIDWGVPFEARPTAFRIKFKYEGLGDSCTIMSTLENRIDGERRFVGVAWYSAITDNDETKEGVIRISEPDANGLRTLETEFIYGRQHSNSDPFPPGATQGEATEQITHVNVVFASSRRGDHFKGKKNAKLIVKDFEFIY
ncbi:MAG: PCMD domain-containing protein [Bacteroidales bacterium]|jgi:hypothetical protein|nr:PCMD domain-containing protein [Bacteroidales bacterium]